MNKTNTIFATGGIIGLVSLIALFVHNVQIFDESSQEIQKELGEIVLEIDTIVNRDIELCEEQASSVCNKVMLAWQEECKKEEMKNVQSCNDGRITHYLIIQGLI